MRSENTPPSLLETYIVTTVDAEDSGGGLPPGGEARSRRAQVTVLLDPIQTLSGA
jgi:hypothetical protein